MICCRGHMTRWKAIPFFATWFDLRPAVGHFSKCSPDTHATRREPELTRLWQILTILGSVPLFLSNLIINFDLRWGMLLRYSRDEFER